MQQPSVSLCNVTKRYGSKKNIVTACDSINLEVSCGHVIGLLGPNGAGKSTVLNMVCGRLLPDSGTVTVCGTTDTGAIRSVTGFVSETPELDPHLTVKETLFFECSLYGMPQNKALEHIKHAVKDLELESVLEKKVSVLSKGFAQRTSLARAICTDPQVLVLDEFSGGLDPAQIVGIRSVIKKLSKTKAVIFSTHHIDEALSLCDRMYIMNHGSIVQSGSAEEIVKATHTQNLEQAFLRLTGGAQ
ncbi:MAG: ABC transporter ATP-binding protein [Treponema sp.]|nr:ABC transporter ATP-binding protein [Treponema sp.]